MGKKGKKAQAAKPKKPTPKDIGKRLDALVRKLEEELKGADLFAPLPPMEDCAICFMPLSRVALNSAYKFCCGKLICFGCEGENQRVFLERNAKNDLNHPKVPCPFCRKAPTSDEYVQDIYARASKNDGQALFNMGVYFVEGLCGFPQDELKGIDCLIRAIELGSREACNKIALCFDHGTGVPKCDKRAAFFFQIGALRGESTFRHNLGSYEYEEGNYEIAIRHWKIAAEAGMQPALNSLKGIFNAAGEEPGKEFISKEGLDRIYRACHVAQEKLKSEGRERHLGGIDHFKC